MGLPKHFSMLLREKSLRSVLTKVENLSTAVKTSETDIQLCILIAASLRKKILGRWLACGLLRLVKSCRRVGQLSPELIKLGVRHRSSVLGICWIEPDSVFLAEKEVYFPGVASLIILHWTVVTHRMLHSSNCFEQISPDRLHDDDHHQAKT